MQTIPKFNTTLNGHPVFIPAMVWHLPASTLPESIKTLRTLDKNSFAGRGLCMAVSIALEPYIGCSIDAYTGCSIDAYNWVGAAVCYFDHTKKQTEETWLDQYLYYRFGLWGPNCTPSLYGAHYTREQISALRLAWLGHIINHLEEAVAE